MREKGSSTKVNAWEISRVRWICLGGDVGFNLSERGNRECTNLTRKSIPHDGNIKSKPITKGQDLNSDLRVGWHVSYHCATMAPLKYESCECNFLRIEVNTSFYTSVYYIAALFSIYCNLYKEKYGLL